MTMTAPGNRTIRAAEKLAVAAANRVRQGWGQGATARTARGATCRPDAPKARAWSAIGAYLLEARRAGYGWPVVWLVESMMIAYGTENGIIGHRFENTDAEIIEAWNDHRNATQEGMADAFEGAAAMLREMAANA